MKKQAAGNDAGGDINGGGERQVMVATPGNEGRRHINVGEKAGRGMKVASKSACGSLAFAAAPRPGKQAGYASNSISHFNFSHL